jgi:16S rRNA (uracil1498-N3)-methyltransferase
VAVHWFYVPDFSGEDGSYVGLDEEQTTHLVKSLRAKSGTRVYISNGHGVVAQAEFLSVVSGSAALRVFNVLHVASPQPNVSIALSPLKHPDRLEWAVEKLSELGVRNFYPILCEQTEKPSIRIERLERIAQSALKQSGGAWLMSIYPIMGISDWARQVATTAKKWVPYAIERGELPTIDVQSEAHQEIVIAIGPEGDFTKTEMDMLFENNFQPCSLGPLRLRSETAAVAAASLARIASKA